MPQHPSGEPTPFGGPTGLLGGWSYLNDPEPCSFPSTVDMAAFKAGPSDTINAPCTQATTPSGSSDSEGSNSSSSDSDSSSSSGGGPRPRAATAPGPRFSVTSSDSAGLRLKIAAIPNRQVTKPKDTEKKTTKTKLAEKEEPEKVKGPSSSDSSCDSESCSGCSDSESAPENVKTSQGSARTRSARLKKSRKKKANRGGSTSSRSESSESDSSEDSLQEINAEDLAAILPPEDFNGFEAVPGAPARPRGETEDVAACDGASSSDMELPAQLVHAAIQRAESGSETEALRSTPNPQYASTLLQEFVAKTQILSHTPQTPSKNNLSLSSSDGNKSIEYKEKSHVQIVKDSVTPESQEKDKTVAEVPIVEQSTTSQPETKRKRGRPKKQIQPPARESPALVVAPNESPDSGILSNPHSPAQSPTRAETRRRTDKTSGSGCATNIKQEVKPPPQKMTISSLERTTYATERVLYPPRGRVGRPAKRGPGRPPKIRSTRAQSASPMPKTKQEDLIDPIWREIDLNKKFRGPKLCGYKSDHGSVPTCSKTLAAQSGYLSDYGGTRVRSRSGYRSDHSTKGRCSGYRSDYSTKAKSCGYRSDCSVRKRKTVRKKRKDRNRVQNTMTELDIMKIAFLNLGQSNDDSNSNDSVPAKSLKVENKFSATSFDFRGNLFVKNETNFNMKPLDEVHLKQSIDSPTPTFPNLGVSKKIDENVQRRKSNSFLTEICERVTRSLASTDSTRPVLKNLSPKSNVTENRKHRSRKMSTIDNDDNSRCSFAPIVNGMLKTKTKNIISKSTKNILLPKSVQSRRLSSRSNHIKPLLPSKMKKIKKRRRSRSVSRSEMSIKTDTKINPEIDNLILSFVKLCQITPEKVPSKEKPQPEPVKCLKRASKKRKGSENNEVPVTVPVSSKRRHKKMPPTQSPDEHKLPLKKRHYLLAPGAESRSSRATAGKSTIASTRPEIKEQKITEPIATSTSSDIGSAVEIFRAHMDEAIEACISKYTSPTKTNSSTLSNSPNMTPSKAVTPKKRHLLESPSEISVTPNSESLNSSSNSELTVVKNLNTDLSISDSIQLKCQNQIRKCEISTRKKNRLEGLVSKIQPGASQALDCQVTSNQKVTQPTRPTVIRTPGQEVVEKPQPPPGVFEPSIDIELQIPVSTISLSAIVSIEKKLEKTIQQSVASTKTVVEEINNKINNLKPNKKKTSSGAVEYVKSESVKQLGKKRRRKTINRTGFPTKKKKKKPSTSENSQRDENKIVESLANNVTELKSSVKSNEKVQSINNNEKSTKSNEKSSDKCDRVPGVGEDTAAFIERSVRPRLSVVSLDKLQGKSEDISNGNDGKPDKKIAQNLLQERPKRKLRDLSPGDILVDEIALSKRQLRVKAEKLVVIEAKEGAQNNKKRLRENSSNELNISKKAKDETSKSKKPRDNSSDNEPLSTFIEKKNSTIKSEIKNTKPDNNTNKRMLQKSKTDPEIIITSRSRSSKLATEANERSRSQLGNKVVSKNEPSEIEKGPSKILSKDHIEPVPNERSERSKSRAENKLTRTEVKSVNPEVVKSRTSIVQKLDKPNLSKVKRSDKFQINNAATDNIIVKVSKSDKDKADAIETEKLQRTEDKDISSTELRISGRHGRVNKKLTKLSRQGEVQQDKTEQPESVVKENNAEDKLQKSNTKSKITKGNKPEQLTISDEEKSVIQSVDVVKTRSSKLLNKDMANRRKPKGNNKLPSTAENVCISNERPASRQSVKSLSKTSEISIVIPDRPKSRLSTTCLPTPPLESVDAIEQEPLPVSEGPEDYNIRDDSPVSSDRSGGSGDKNGKKKAPKWKKKYLVAGLLSDYYKDDESKAADTRTLRTPYRHEDHPFGLLPPPPYCEKYFRKSIRDFQLPFDLWWQHKHSKLPGRDIVPSWNYRKIRTNVYYDTRPNLTCESQACSCVPDSGCPDECINRLVYAECAPQLCPCKDRCRNQSIQRHEGAPALERFMTENKGWGVRTKLPITCGSFILEYVGEVVTEREFKHRMGNRYLRDTHHYCLHLDGGLVIDGHRMGGDGRFVNHSCAPNCEMQKWSVNGLSRMALFALRDIKDGEELTYDYNFSLFNPSEGQPCRCGSSQCRGVIGGKSQRITRTVEPKPVVTEQQVQTVARVGRPRKRQARRSPRAPCKEGIQPQPTLTIPNTRERTIIKESKCFMLRNLDKVRRLRDRFIGIPSAPIPPSSSQTLSAHISVLRGSRSIRTRGLALIEDDPEISRTAKLAALLTEMCTAVSGLKDETGQPLMTRLAPPSKKKVPLYYERIPCPIDLSEIELNIETGVYRSPQAFDTDMKRLFSNAVKFYGTGSPEGNAAQTLTEIYNSTKVNIAPRLKDTVGESDDFSLDTFLPQKEKRTLNGKDTGEDIIRCICGLFKDEGLMIQCSSCLVWQHIECIRVDPSIEKYLCDRCEPRKVDLEIPLEEFTEEGHRYYLSLMRGELQLRQGDTVYVLRDIPITPQEGSDSNAPVAKHTYETIGHIDYSEMDIFRVERLWKNEEGKRFVFGHHYLRPHETFHEPSRKFYPNEVVRVPLFEVVPIELVMARCWVLDPKTYCRGRPVDSAEPHVYICELRVDRAARLFTKISRHPYPICTKNYAFHKFEQKLKISRTYVPHDLGPIVVKVRSRRGGEEPPRKQQIQLPPPPPVKTRNDRRAYLESVLLRLMQKLPASARTQPGMDLSYLLTGRGARSRRPAGPNNS